MEGDGCLHQILSRLEIHGFSFAEVVHEIRAV
jgi:hypothetical protein